MAKNSFSIRDFYRRHPFLSNLLMVVATGFVILWLVLLFLDYWTMHGATAVVPQVKHKSYAEAKSILMTNKLGIEISDSIYDRTLAPGTIVASWPKAGAIVKEGRQVYVTITAFSPKQVTISMPLTGNVSSRQAMSYLRGIGITDIRTLEVPSEYADLVLDAKYGDTPLSVGSVIPITSTVTLTIGCATSQDTDSMSEYVEDEFIEPDFSDSDEL